jgi:methylated-DNA-protein-cysteine methyltransferase related protein
MPGSAAFARIHRDVMAIVARVPRGRITTFAAIGAFLDVVPRQVAFLLARRHDPAREAVPWWRVVGVGGALGREKRAADGRTQAALLQAEGLELDGGKVVEERSVLFVPTTRNTGVTPTPRPARRGLKP